MPAPKEPNADSIGVIDIFAGPGGLGEGFSTFVPQGDNESRPFELAVSAEMERNAHATLRLRTFLRHLQAIEGPAPAAYLNYLRAFSAENRIDPAAHFGTGPWKPLWDRAGLEALNLTMGEEVHNEILHRQISDIKSKYSRLVLIGGPPCQAYSLVGRARQRNVKDFATKGDHRHFLYREYLHILAKYSPDVFIMENVKGILTSTVGKNHMFTAIHEDLSNPSRALGLSKRGRRATSEYVLLPVHVDAGKLRSVDEAAEDPRQFIIRSEKHGIPQARHRVIIMGVRADRADKAMAVDGLDLADDSITLEEALSDLPRLRSGISYARDDANEWAQTVQSQLRSVRASTRSVALRPVRDVLDKVVVDPTLPRSARNYESPASTYGALLRTPNQPFVLNHDTRGHMAADLGRYLFCAAFAEANNRSPNSPEFPESLSPDHANWESGAFSDRFRVQLKNRPSRTITSHLSKDGHAFIHWDPRQCRSLTVREAARLQSFPDDYLFLGNRSQQFVQVGNAVPPALARQIARIVWEILD